MLLTEALKNRLKTVETGPEPAKPVKTGGLPVRTDLVKMVALQTSDACRSCWRGRDQELCREIRRRIRRWRVGEDCVENAINLQGKTMVDATCNKLSKVMN